MFYYLLCPTSCLCVCLSLRILGDREGWSSSQDLVHSFRINDCREGNLGLGKEMTLQSLNCETSNTLAVFPCHLTDFPSKCEENISCEVGLQSHGDTLCFPKQCLLWEKWADRCPPSTPGFLSSTKWQNCIHLKRTKWNFIPSNFGFGSKINFLELIWIKYINCLRLVTADCRLLYCSLNWWQGWDNEGKNNTHFDSDLSDSRQEV